MTDLLTRLEAAEEGSRELGEEVLLAAGWRKTCVGHFHGPMYRWSPPKGHGFDDGDFHLHNPTTSLDAKLPGENITVVVKNRYGTWTAFHEPENDSTRPASGFAKTEILARRIAALRAKQ